MIGRFKKLWERDEVPTCKLCSTPLEEAESTCPSCGYMAASDSHVFYIPDAGDSLLAATPDLAHELLDPNLRAGARPDVRVNTPVFALRPAGLRELLANQPEMLEPGLRIVTDEMGEPVGAGFSTSVGEIDLLARDGSGGFVVVRIGERGQGEKLIAETLQQVGWVRKHLGKGKQRVRGMVLLEQVPKDLGYVSAAVADTILVKTYRVALALEDLKI